MQRSLLMGRHFPRARVPSKQTRVPELSNRHELNQARPNQYTRTNPNKPHLQSRPRHHRPLQCRRFLHTSLRSSRLHRSLITVAATPSSRYSIKFHQRNLNLWQQNLVFVDEIMYCISDSRAIREVGGGRCWGVFVGLNGSPVLRNTWGKQNESEIV